MTPDDTQRIQAFIAKWQHSEGNEQANSQPFFVDLCAALGVDGPPPKDSSGSDTYSFEKAIKTFSAKGQSSKRADFYKEGCFLLEAKQGSFSSSKGHGKRGTKIYDDVMQGSFNQARQYIQLLDRPTKPPFLITCDIGYRFDIWQGFSGEYGSYGARQRVNLAELQQPEVFDRFVAIFTDPQSLNPEKLRAKVTREVAAELAKLSRWLEDQGHDPQTTASFLMRCIFTMFAEDVELLPGEVFTKALRDRWIPNPATFKPEIEQLWQTMNTGGTFGFERVLQFNGSFFQDATAFDLPKAQLEVLLAAAEKDWKEVEPAIFGTLVERALEKKERSRLGAHYTPRSYVERLVRPVVMEPLRQEWDEIELEVKRLLEPEAGKEDPTANQRKKAEQEIRVFLDKLRQIKILDPACGTGNFLYVSLDLLKGLEAEVQTRLVDVAGNVQLNVLEQINPSQFLGIEINPRAAAIAELVIWIGYLQWFFKRYGNAEPPEPVLQAFNNIENRDAVLAYDGTEPDVDAKTGQVRTRWGGRMMRHPVTGEQVPDPSDQVVILKYLNARAAEWPEADYVVSNPPFLGKLYMQERLGEGYVTYLRRTYNGLVPDSCDLVMYWWCKAARRLSQGEIAGFGFVTTNSITQTFNRRVIEEAINRSRPIHLKFAIPDHPWVNTEDCAAVRISMTACETGKGDGKLALITRERSDNESGDSTIKFTSQEGLIYSDLSIGANLLSAVPLKSNSSLAGIGVMLGNDGFVVEDSDNFSNDSPVIHPITNGRDLMTKSRGLKVIDFYGMTIDKAKQKAPYEFQKILLRVKPERDLNKRKIRRENWWLFAETMPKTRDSIRALQRYIPTVVTAKHRVFTFLDANVIPDVSIVAIALQDTYHLGILSSRIHVT
ncbi:MAG: DNA methyltransferase [Nodosilinea sp.]